jgi:hypothetical protein
MYENEDDQEWNKLQERIENLVGYLLKIDVQSIEYKPQYAVPLLTMSSEYFKNVPEDAE